MMKLVIIKKIMENSEHLQWIHDRMVNVHGENKNVDYLIRLRAIILEQKEMEDGFQEYLDYIEKMGKEKS